MSAATLQEAAKFYQQQASVTLTSALQGMTAAVSNSAVHNELAMRPARTRSV
jgi:hypothetical protein